MARLTPEYRQYCRELVRTCVRNGLATVSAISTHSGLSPYLVRNTLVELGEDALLRTHAKAVRRLATRQLSAEQVRTLFLDQEEPLDVITLRLRARELFKLELLDNHIYKMIARHRTRKQAAVGGRPRFLNDEEVRQLMAASEFELNEGSLTPQLVRMRATRLFNKRRMSEPTAKRYCALLINLWKARPQ